MPCYDVRNSYDFGKQEAKHEIDNLTRMLCGLCREIDNPHYINEVPGLREWWREHQKWDKKRKK